MSTQLTEIPDRFDYERAASIYKDWEEDGCFHANPDSGRPPFTIVIPPPNVTGALHLGHALNNTLQDIQIRWHRMQGYEALWMPGTDHAGIATQAVVERRLRELEGKSRHDLGREALIQRIWDWKQEYESRILNQLKTLGCSCDWSRTRFTLDDVCAKAVRTTFFDLFAKRLIYRGKRLVNWDTFLQTAVSDDEVNHVSIQGHFWHFRYPVLNPGAGEPTDVTIATTRPETMLGDTAVAVHPAPEAALDEVAKQLAEKLEAAASKEKHAIQQQLDDLNARRESQLPLLKQLAEMAERGVKLQLPLTDREIPLIADEWAKPELGSGCVKITPAHDPNDYEVGLRCDLPMINIMNQDGTLNANAGDKYAGLTMKKARAQVVEDLEALGLMDEIEEREIELAHSDRSKTPIEPFLADQWFVKMDQLAQNAMDAVTDGRVKILPERYTSGYLDWLSEKRDWPVGRQLWWGHQIPIWTQEFPTAEAAQAELKRLESLPAAASGVLSSSIEGETLVHACVKDQAELEQKLEAAGYVRQEDVLDTWFSSALWPHSTLGWPEQTEELDYFYPTSTLITSRDIITLWVARMVLMGLNNLGEVPFREVYIHPKILDGLGETMSKSKGNGVDPIDVIAKFGPDALRFGLARLATETQDQRMPVQYECPHCQTAINQTKQNRIAKVVTCKACQKDFSTQWAESEEELAHPKAPVISERFEVARNFCNKLWNAARFAMLNLEDFRPVALQVDQLPLEDRWILSRLSTTIREVTSALQTHRYSEASRIVYDFAWDEYCSYYVEMAKPRLDANADAEVRAATQQVLVHVLDQLLRLLHPMIPFITEAIWQALAGFGTTRALGSEPEESKWLMKSAWPKDVAEHCDENIEEQFKTFVSALTVLREIRAAQGIPPKGKVEFCIRCDAKTAALLEPMRPYFLALANGDCTQLGDEVPEIELAAKASMEGMELTVDLGEFIDFDAEIERNEKQLAGTTKSVQGKQGKLSNKNFVDRAPAEVVEKERAALADLEAKLKTIQANIERLQAAKAAKEKAE